METRKIQTIRDSTHLISLPKRWVDQLGIVKGTPMSMKLNSDGTILLVPPGDRQKEHLHYDLETDSTDGEHLLRDIIGVYLGGYQTIKIRPTVGISRPLRRAVREACSRVRGLEIMEETDRFVILQDLLNPLEFNAKKGVRRMYLEARAMIEEAVAYLSGEEGALGPSELNERDTEIDRINLILIKQHNLLMRDLSLTDKVGIPLEESVNYLHVAQHLERVGDYAQRLGDHPELVALKPSEQLIHHMQGASRLALKALDDSIEAFYRRDAHLAHQTIDHTSKLSHLARTIPVEMANPDKQLFGHCAPCLEYYDIFNCIDRIGLYSRSIAEVALNQARARK